VRIHHVFAAVVLSTLGGCGLVDGGDDPATITLRTDLERAELYVDGRPAGRLRDGRPLQLAPGRHTLEARSGGRVLASVRRQVESGQKVEVRLDGEEPAAAGAPGDGSELEPPASSDVGATPAPAAGRVRGTVQVGALAEQSGPGRIDPEVVARQIRVRRSTMARCYEDELRSDPTLGGRLTVRLRIEPRGTVTDVRATENATGSPAVARCVVSAIERLRFNPGPEGGSVSLVYPFTLAPRG
jgi:TonB family protein